ncbi:MAG: MarR family winged helix-turn-helix transcriptional regulator [Actinomycetota bacterium]|nr:MarR family winged helix-turn-helix transcriptional regulator [Actinomycetota bacterium]
MIDHQAGYAALMATASPDVTAGVPVGALMARLGHEATARFRRALRPLDLRPQEFIVLKQLQAMGSTSQGALADAVGVDYSNLATVAGGLCERGLIARARDDADRRRYALELSPAGRRLVERADRAIAAGEDELLGALNPAEREEFSALLRQVADAAEICPTATARACA